ncbi:MAG TPA: thioredoxin family protein [Trebonia sp.]|nr:thioredoxin family protein [Trebonia sp.]
MPGLIALVAALAVATALGGALRLRAGRMRAPGASRSAPLTAADLAAPLGEQATLVQFSTEFCAYCGPARELLGEVAAAGNGVALIEIDAAERMDLARRLNVFATPTVFVLGPAGDIRSRIGGVPRKADVLRAVGTAR